MTANSVQTMPAKKSWPFGIIIAVLAIVGVLVVVTLLATDGSKRGLAAGLGLALLPLALYSAISRPFLFPFGLYVILVPFDTVLRIPHFGTITKLVGVSSALAFAFLLVRTKRYVHPPKAVLMWLAFLVLMSLSVFWAMDPVAAGTGLVTYASLIALFAIISLMPITKREYDEFLFTVVLGGLAGAAYAVYLFHIGAFVQHQQVGSALTARLLVRFGDEKLDPNAFSAAFFLPIAIALTWALQRSWSLTKIGLIGATALLVGAVYVNGSRGAFVAMAVMIGYMVLRGRFKVQLATLSLLVLGASFLSPVSPWARFSNALSSGGAGRVSIWKVGFEAFKHHWLIGAGTGNFAVAYNQSFLSVYQKYYAGWARAPHNTPLEFAVDLGIFGLLLLLLAWYTQLRSLHMIDRSSPLFDMRVAIEGAVVALFVASLFLSVMPLKCTWLLFGAMAVTRAFALRAAQSRGPTLPAHSGLAFETQLGARRAFKEPANAL